MALAIKNPVRLLNRYHEEAEGCAVTTSKVRLGDVAEVQLGKMLSPKAHGGGDGGQPAPYLRNVNVQWGHVDLSDLLTMDFDDRERKKFSLRQGDVLVCEGGEPGRCAVLDTNLEGVFFQKALMRVRTKSGVLDSRYLQWFMQHAAARGVFAQDGNQATIAHFPAVRLNALEIPLPPLPEQRRIADILDKADAIRRKHKEAIALTEELLRSAFLEMFGDPVTNPKGWATQGIESQCETIVDCVNRTATTVDYATPYKMIRTTNVKAGRVFLNDVKFVTQETFEEWNRRCVPRRNDVLLTREAPVGEAGILLADDHVFLGQRLMLYRTDPKFLLPEYLVEAFRGAYLQSQFDTHGSGSTVKHLPLPVCRSLKVRVPPISLQSKFAALVRILRTKEHRHEVALKSCNAMFDSLVQRAFGGKCNS